MIKRIGDYEIRFEIGRGGFGRVYQAFDPRVQRQVAIKVLNTEADANLITRFRTEASAAGNLHHKNIVTVYGYGEDGGHHYIVMEYLDGQTLQDLIPKNKTLTLAERVDIMSQVAAGLICAHQNGVVHRDVKPANVMVMANQTVKIMDFGIARVLRDGAARLTQSGFLVGTISYMAPEQFDGADVDALCDIWAYGVIYYELLTGMNPFAGADPGAVMYQITSCDPERVSKLCPDCPPALERAVHRLLSKDRDARYQSLEDVQFDVAPLLLQLQRVQAAALLGEAAGLMHKQKFEEAGILTRKILDLDPSNAEARQLREAIQEEMRQRTIRPRVSALMRQAETEADRRNYSYALRAVESALRLTPADVAIQQYRASLLATIGKVEEAARLLTQARTELEADDPATALKTVQASLKADPENQDARGLLEQIQSELKEQERRAALHHDLNRAEVLLDLSALQEAAVLLDRLATENPSSIEVVALVERLVREKEEHERRQWIREELDASRRLLKESGPAAAIARLEALEEEFPEENEVLTLLAEAREQLRKQEQDRACEELRTKAWDLASGKEFEAALAILDQGLVSYPGHSTLTESLKEITSSKASHERALRLEGEVQRCRQMRLDGLLDDAATLAETLVKEYGEDAGLAEERCEIKAALARRERQRTIEDALEKATLLLESGDAGAAIGVIRGTLQSTGAEPRLDELLVRATAVQKEVERRKDIEARVAKALQHEAASEWDAALALLAKGLELHGAVPEMETAAARISKLKGINDYKRQIEQCIREGRWSDARECIGPAGASHPEENPAWQEFEARIWAGALQEEIETALSGGDLDRAAAKLEEARAGVTPLATAGVLEARLQELRFRQQMLDQAYSLTGQGDHAGAEVPLRELLQRRPTDREATSLLKTVQERREQQEREARRERGRAEARNLSGDGRFDDAIRLLKALIKEFGNDPGLKSDLAFTQAAAASAKEKAEREATLTKGLAEARQLMTKGDLRAATRRFHALAKEFPDDPDVQRETTAVEQAREARKREEARQEGRKKAQKLVADRKFDEALTLLRPLLQEASADRELQETWRAAMEGKGRRADWLEVYETLAELEELYKKGKAKRVYQRSRALLEQVEQPRARELFKWAESMLPHEGASGIRIGKQQILVIVGVVLLLVIVLVATRCGK